jgi:hypothetical protein
VNQWLRRRLLAAGFDVSSSLDACVADFAELEEADQRKVIRAGFRTLLASVVKSEKLTIPNGRNVQLPLFASVLDEDRWVRVSYLLVDLEQLRQLVDREGSRIKRNGERLRRMKKDLALYEQHPDAPNLEAVWLAEHVEYRLEQAA